MLENVLFTLLGIALALAGTWVWWRQVGQPGREAREALLQSELNQKRREAELQIEQQLTRTRLEVEHLRAEAEKEVERRYAEVARSEGRLEGIRLNQEKQLQAIEKREQRLNKRQTHLDQREAQIKQNEDGQQAQLKQFEAAHHARLEEVAGMTLEEARAELLVRAEQTARQDMARIIRQVDEEARETAEEQARKHIATAIQRIASDYVAETTTSTVAIPGEETKGRIIGRNGRNIRAFEQAAGVDIVVDDTPEAVTISSFDPVRREVARRALEKLVLDGRIHPARIEKLIKDTEKEVGKVMREAGEQAAFEANVHGLHPEIIKMLGRLKFRSSYGQNQLGHAIEASHIAGLLAAEIGANVQTCKMGALLHDLGKAMDHNQEGTHALLGAEYAKRFNVPAIVVNAIASHHHEVDQESIEAIIVESADAISGARPGARRESLEHYIKRVRTLEDIALSFHGVESAYALQAGREIRVLVRPGQVDDLGAIQLSRDISRTIESSMQYPGQIQVTIIRETRAVGFAK
jgi:ribonuclease Y